MGMIAKPDQREWKQNRLTKRKMACQLEDDEDELSGRGEWMVLSDINRVAASKPATTAKKKKKQKTKNERENSKGTRVQHPQVCYLHLRGWISRTSKWQEQCKPQPLMFSHHSDGHPEQLWCTLPWALEVIFCFLTHFVYARIWIF